ncbi:hypothetical protein [Aquimarina pacifica]|uniref:hypothetical protein n=1 Tax=Aquimarina pacifica TaxID=1296415 RepID=UPI0004728185|nr:hypothetical protein [Aquimarina pacifica]
MKIDDDFIKQSLKEALIKGFLFIRDHRNNKISVCDGIFTFNDCQQPKTIKTIEGIFLEALKLTRYVQFNDDKYYRTGSKWAKKPNTK